MKGWIRDAHQTIQREIDNIGIKVNTDEAYRAYAEGLGIEVSDLTNEQKLVAFFEAVVPSSAKP